MNASPNQNYIELSRCKIIREAAAPISTQSKSNHVEVQVIIKMKQDVNIINHSNITCMNALMLINRFVLYYVMKKSKKNKSNLNKQMSNVFYLVMKKPFNIYKIMCKYMHVSTYNCLSSQWSKTQMRVDSPLPF